MRLGVEKIPGIESNFADARALPLEFLVGRKARITGCFDRRSARFDTRQEPGRARPRRGHPDQGNPQSGYKKMSAFRAPETDHAP